MSYIVTHGDIIRAVRIREGLNQKDFGKKLGLNQSRLSKLEHSDFVPKVDLWEHFCEEFQVPLDARIKGYVDIPQPVDSLKVLSGSHCENFQIPERYSDNRGSFNRGLFNWIDILSTKIGRKKTDELLRYMGFDPAFFLFKHYQLNLQFLLDFIGQMVRLGARYEFILEEFSKTMKNWYLTRLDDPEFDSREWKTKTKSLLKNGTKRMDINYNYMAIDEKKDSIDLMIVPQSHIDVRISDATKGFLNLYRALFFVHIIGRKIALLETTPIRGDQRCIYRVY